ncbi:MAG TPA: RDD family protein [Lacipirellula sp.]
MPSPLQFETPENVVVQYEVAGLGTRFTAWLLDQIFVTVLCICLIIALAAAGLSLDIVTEGLQADDEALEKSFLYFIGFMILVWSLGGFVYFSAAELLLRGQTVGKRASKIRVVKANGFQLDAPSIVIRNLFRVVDHLPPLWLIPLFTPRSQRAGDLVAGTMVVSDARSELSSVRTVLAGRKSDAQFRFDRASLKKLAAADFTAVEQILERWTELDAMQQRQLSEVACLRIAKKLGVDCPEPDARVRFLEDLLAAEFTRRERSLA